MRDQEIKKRFEDIERRLTEIDNTLDGSNRKTEQVNGSSRSSTITSFHHPENTLEVKKDNDEVQDGSLSGDTNYEQGRVANSQILNTEQMPVNEDNQPLEDELNGENKNEVLEKKRGRPRKTN